MNSRLYATARNELAKMLSDPIQDAERREKIKAAYAKRRELGLKKVLSDDHKAAIASWNIGRKHGSGVADKISTSGRALFAAMRAEGKQRWAEVQCLHCNLQGRGPNMTRYHFDSCKRRVI